VKELRSTLKGLISKDLDKLPETLEQLEPKDRLDYMVKLLPYAMPKTDKINPTYGEPVDFDW